MASCFPSFASSVLVHPVWCHPRLTLEALRETSHVQPPIGVVRVQSHRHTPYAILCANCLMASSLYGLLWLCCDDAGVDAQSCRNISMYTYMLMLPCISFSVKVRSTGLKSTTLSK